MTMTMQAAEGAREARARALLQAPIAPTVLRLALPTTMVMIVQAGVSICETIFVGQLGTESLAGFALVFPLMMLMQMMSAGGMGGGVSSAIARAMGRGRPDEAARLSLHALAIAAGLGLFFTAFVLMFGEDIYRALGGRDAALAEAMRYSNLLFSGIVATWAVNTAAAALRGAGNMRLPAVALTLSATLQVPLAWVLIFGAGPVPAMGIAGAAAAMIVAHGFAAALLIARLFMGSAGYRPRLAGFRFERSLFADILRVGAIASVMTVVANLTTILLTGLVGGFGTAAIAAYGIGARLEFMQIPLVFGVGAALTTLVGVNFGARQVARAERIAWTGAAMATAGTGLVGAFVTFWPDAWIGLFTADPAVIAPARLYLVTVGPAYALLGLAMALYFAAQGAGRMLWPFIGGTGRILIATLGGAYAVSAGYGLQGLFVCAALGLVAFGASQALALRFGAWRD